IASTHSLARPAVGMADAPRDDSAAPVAHDPSAVQAPPAHLPIVYASNPVALPVPRPAAILAATPRSPRTESATPLMATFALLHTPHTARLLHAPKFPSTSRH